MSSDRPVPESLPRQKAFTYIFLVGITGCLIYFYSYPLSTENWAYIKQKLNYGANTDEEPRFVVSDANGYRPVSSNDEKKITGFVNVGNPAKVSQTKSVGINEKGQRTSPVTKREVTVETIRNDGQKNGTPSPAIGKTEKKTNKIVSQNDSSETSESTQERSSAKAPDIIRSGKITHENTTQITEKRAEILTNEYKRSTKMAITDAFNHKVSPPMNETGTLNRKFTTDASYKDISEPDIAKGYLVFSEQCRIPDLDPMHPSIAHLISKTPPLDCSENHRPLTRTEGHVLFLNETAALERAGGNYTCCYRKVFREMEGQSDNEVGTSKKCIPISDKAIIKNQFISVECKHGNGTTFYREYHSFIFDKPKVEKRCGKGTDSQYSVLIIGVDAVSRLNMHRQLNATAEYMLKEMDAVEMYGFNKVGDNTFPNLIPMLLGYDERELPSVCWQSKDLPLDRCNFLWKRFAKRGYRTFYAEDSPHISTFNYAKRGFYLQPTDYYFRPFILAYEDTLGRDKPLNCYLCVGSTSETEAVLHWTEQFASHFAKRPYFAFSWINSVTHDFLNTGSSVDHMYERFFRTLHQKGALEKAVVILMGDHGMRWGQIRHTYVGRLEERLPMLMISVPQKFRQDYPEFAKILRQNSRKLITPFDLHATLAHILELKEGWSITNLDKVTDELSQNFTRRALSLFQPIPKDRSCDDAFIEEHWCTCESSIEVDLQRDEVKRVAKFLQNHINSLLKPVSDKCAFLQIESITEARLWQPPAEHKGHSVDDSIYTAVIQTTPGKAVFEGTVKITQSKPESELLGTISRLNLYGNQSSCISDAILKKYCYCL